MASTHTTELRIEKITTGEQSGTWGTTTNTQYDLWESAISGTVTVNFASDGNDTLSTANGSDDESRHAVVLLSGATALTATRNMVCPTSSKLYIVDNSTTGSQSVQFKTSGGTGITIPNGARMPLYCDATNVVAAFDHTTKLTFISDTAAGDLATAGYAAADGLKLTGQGSTRDISLYNDADVLVMGVLTGTTTAAFEGEVTGTGFTGTLDGILGGGTPAAVTGTTGTFSGVLSIDDTTDSTTGTSGSIHTDGGLGVAKDLVVAGEVLAANGTAANPSLSFASETGTGFWNDGGNTIKVSSAGAEVARFTSTSGLFVGDTGNANMTAGLTLEQAGADNEILALKSSDVAHGFTDWMETDTYTSYVKVSPTVGGLRMNVVAESSYNQPFLLRAIGGATSTGKATGSNAGIVIQGGVHDGSNGWTGFASNANVLAIRTFSNVGADVTQFIIDEDGDYFYNGADGGAFDEHDDALICRSFDLARGAKGIIKGEWDKFASENAATLTSAGILGEVDPTDPEYYLDDGTLAKPLVNGAQLQRLHNGAIWQQRAMFEVMKQTLDEMIPGFGMKLANALTAQNLPALPV